MEPKKDFSTAILDSKKAPNKLIVLICSFRLNNLSMMKTLQFSYHKQKWQNLKFSKGTQFSSKEKRESKL